MTERLTKEQRQVCYVVALVKMINYWEHGLRTNTLEWEGSGGFGDWEYNIDGEKVMDNGVCGYLAYEGKNMVGEEEYVFCYWNVDVDFPEFYEQRPEREIDTCKLWWPNTDIESRKTALQNAIKLCE